jgi:hypothetical protein
MREMTGPVVGAATLTRSSGTKLEGALTVMVEDWLVTVVVVVVETVVMLTKWVALGVTVTVEWLVRETWIVWVVAVKEYHVGVAAPVGRA